MKKTVFLFLALLCQPLFFSAQDFTILSSVKENDYYKTKIKFGRDVNYETENVFEMKNANGDMYFACLLYAYENFPKGSTKEVALSSSGAEISTATKMMKLGSNAVQDGAARFKASSSTAFIADGAGYYAFVNDGITGSVKTGDKISCLDEDKKTIEASVTKLTLVTPAGRMEIKGIDERFRLSNGFSLEIQFTCSGPKGPSGKFTFQAPGSSPAAASNSGNSGSFNGKREVISKNIVMTDGNIKITLNNLVRYYPKQSENTVFKIDETLDYYILDVSLENVSSKPVEAGQYLLHLNLYDASGINSDDHGRLFKDASKDASTQKDIDAVDKQVLGGTSSLRYATVLTMYSSNDPSFSQKAYDAAWSTLKPGEKAGSTSVKIIGVPKTYKPVEIGFWLDDSKKTTKAKL